MELRKIKCAVDCYGQIEAQYEWKVGQFFPRFEKGDDRYHSPDIQFSGFTFTMRLVYFHSTDDFDLFLGLERPNSPITIRYTVGMKTQAGDTEVWGSGRHEFSMSDKVVHIGDWEKSYLLNRSYDSAPCDDLTITACLKTDISFLDTGTKDVAVQTSAEATKGHGGNEGRQELENTGTTEVAVQTSVDDAGGQESNGGHQALEHTGTTDVAVQTNLEDIREQDGNGEHQTLEITDFATFCQNIEELKGKDCDVTLEVRGIQFRIHKGILEARAPVLAEMLSDSTAKAETAVVCVEDCHPGAFEVFLRFVYTGVAVNLTSENATDVYYVANKYDLPGLKEECVRHMISHFTTGSICSVLDLAERHGEELLKEKATEFLVENAREVFRTAAWRKFTEENGLAYDLITRVHKNWK